MRRRRRALVKYAVPLSVVGIAAAPALAPGVPAPATFAPAVVYPLGVQPAYNMGVGDFNRDGNLDAVIPSPTGDFSVVPGSGNGTFGAATVIATGVAQPRSVVTGDLTGDNAPDLVFAQYNPFSNGVAINQTAGGVFNFTSPIAPTALPAPQTPGMPALGDLNEDGKLDIVQPGYADGTGHANAVNVRMGNGDGTFQAASQPFTNPITGVGPMGAAIADVNGDGHLDVVVSLKSGGVLGRGSILTALGNGDGTLQMPASRTSTGSTQDPSALVLADLNGDGDLDAITVNTTQDVSVMLSNGNGTFGTATVDSSLHGYDGAVADLNGDGINDIAVAAYSNSDAIDVELGNGDGTFGTVTHVALPATSVPYGIALADLNGDGLKDILTSTYGTQSLAVLINTSVAMAPAVTAVAPTTGPTAGGTSVTVTGTAFTGATAVTFGGVAATSFTVNSPTSITAVAPPHAAGAVGIAVTTPNGTGTGAGLFTYAGAPAPDPTPDAGGGASTPGAGSTAIPATPAQPTAPGRLGMSIPRTVRGRTLTSTGVVPPGSDRVTQSAARGVSGTARAVFGAWSTGRAQTSCPITSRDGRSIFTCTLRLAPGQWTVTTQALSGSTTVAGTVTKVRMRGVFRMPVTG